MLKKMGVKAYRRWMEQVIKGGKIHQARILRSVMKSKLTRCNLDTVKYNILSRRGHEGPEGSRSTALLFLHPLG